MNSSGKYGRSVSASSIRDTSSGRDGPNQNSGGPSAAQAPTQRVGRGNFTRYLLENAGKAGSNASLSPQTIQKLINPLRSNLGLPSFSYEPTAEVTQPPLKEIQTASATNSSEFSEFKARTNDFSIPKMPVTQERLCTPCSGVNRSYQTTTNSDFDSKENLQSNDSTLGELHSSVMSASTLKCDFPHAEQMNPPYPLSVKTEPQVPSKLMRSLIEANNNNNNSVSDASEVAARIPSSATKQVTGIKNLTNPMNLETIQKSGRREQNSSTTPAVKPKKPLSGSGWKFSNVRVKEDEYLLIQQLGRGGCGEVSLVIEKETRKLFALKTVNIFGASEGVVQDCINEVEMLEGLKDSDLVVHIYKWDVNRAEGKMNIVMEHGQCDLNASIGSIGSSLTKVKYVWERMLRIVNKIHERGIVHSDLKPANFIWAGDSLKIIDFGIASRLQQDHTSIDVMYARGTVNFMSPENIQADVNGNAKVSPKSDIWSLGCILYYMVYGKTPFEHIKNVQLRLMAIGEGKIDYNHPVPQALVPCQDDFLRIMKSCFTKDYRKRPSTVELLQDDFLRR